METYIILIMIVGIFICSTIIGIGGYLYIDSSSKTDTSKTKIDKKLETDTKKLETDTKKLETSSIKPAPAKTNESTPAIISFKAGSQIFTPLNDGGGGNTAYLDRHDIDCNGKPLNELHYKTGDGKIQYEYTCSSGGDLETAILKNTDWNDEGNGNAVFLDRHNIDCGINSVISQLKLVRDNTGKIQYQYKCLPSKHTLICRQNTTPFNDEGGGNSTYLDRHDIKCNDDEDISQLKLVRNNNGNYQYQYTCCKN